ncbi:MAG: aldehyde ferredoxin oxidoreductase family protein [Planctomycetales bacterium]|nr:aldehyde ferredoxin oxidoreductase family protein [Planctomycetales bacterium]
MHGYHGCYLHVDLQRGTAEKHDLSASFLRGCLGGVGLGTRLLLLHGAAKTDPLAADAPLVFAFSPLVGSPLTTSAKFAVVSKSPLTDRLNDSLASSRFAITGKATGCDALVITGAAAQPSLLVIENGQFRLEDGQDLWGLEVSATEHAVRERLGSEFDTAVIGPAGEHLVRYATISHDGRHAGRGGSGAVLGAKRIKAIAVAGDRRVTWADPEGLVQYAKRLSQLSLGPATEKYRELGTASNLLAFNRLSALPTRNFQQGQFAGAEQISPESLAATREKTRASCACCTIGCEHIYGIQRQGEDSNHPTSSDARGRGVRLEYESLFALGSMCGVDDGQVVLEAARRCDELGIDTISAGGTIAFAMECAERGIVAARHDFGASGVHDLKFGHGHAMLAAIEGIARRQGDGDAVADGSRRLARRIGQNTLAFAPQVKGLEIPGYEPRALQTMALGFAVGTRGADHNRSGAYEADFSDQADRRRPTERAAWHAVQTENRAALMDSLILCKFLRGVFDDFAEESATMLRLVTGWDVTADELQATAKQIINTKKRFNIQAGWQPEEDTLPERFLSEALPEDDQARLSRETLRALIRAYNHHRGWTAEGWLT